MKRCEIALFSSLVFVATMSGCHAEPMPDASVYACGSTLPQSADHPEARRYQALIDDIVAEGLPGMMMSISDGANPTWNGAAGYADLKSRVPLAPCQITRVGSTVKTFTATTVLLLAEEGAFDLDDPISDYLPASRIKNLENAQRATIRQLLQHSSGIFNYIVSAHFQTKSLNDLTRVWSPEDLLSYARGRSALFAPGEDVSYSNTGYILLGDLISEVEGRPFWQVFQERLFEPYGLEFTQFAAEDPVPDNIIQGYVDLYSRGEVTRSTDFSGWDYYTADGGLISNAGDLNHFFRSLLDGQIVSKDSLSAMKDFRSPKTVDPEGFVTRYGLGLFEIETSHGPAYIHSGDAIGYFASMVHFPEQDVTISWAVNGNYGKLDDHAQSRAAMERIFDVVLSER